MKVGEESRSSASADAKKTTVTGVEMFRKLLDQGQAGDNVGACCARHRPRRDVSAARFWQAGLGETAHEVQGRGLHPDEGRGGRHTPFFTNYRPAVLLPHDGRDGHRELPEGVEMVMPGDNVKIDVELIVPIAMEEAALRHPRRRPHRRFGVVASHHRAEPRALA